MKPLPLLALAILVLCTVAHAEESTPNIAIEMQVLAIPRKIALPLVLELKQDGRAEAAHERVQELLTAGTAQLIGWPMTTTRSGQRAQLENHHELRYPTEFEPGSASIYYSEKKDGQELVKNVPAKIEGVDTFVSPTSFETRNAGITLDVEPVLSPYGKTIDVKLTAHHVRFRGMRRHVIESPNGAKVVVDQPDFHATKIQNQLRVRSGQRVLLGVVPAEEPADHLELFILKAETRQP